MLCFTSIAKQLKTTNLSACATVSQIVLEDKQKKGGLMWLFRSLPVPAKLLRDHCKVYDVNDVVACDVCYGLPLGVSGV
jgi:hypothetical protein